MALERTFRHKAEKWGTYLRWVAVTERCLFYLNLTPAVAEIQGRPGETCYRAKLRLSAADVLLLKHQTDLNLLFLQMYNFLLGYKDKLDSKPHSRFPELFH